MIHDEVKQLTEKFSKLELHAARSGREVRRVLVALAVTSPAETGIPLLDEIRENVSYLLRFLPPYAPPLYSINQVLLSLEEAIEDRMDLAQFRSTLAKLDGDYNNANQNAHCIAAALETLLPQQAVLYTHTLSETVLNTVIELHRRDIVQRVYVTESRPNNDGWYTAQRLSEEGMETCLTIDAAMPAVIGQADCMVTGAEIINRDGSVVGKVGAYPAAVFCRMAGKPVYILADTGKVSLFHHANYFLTPITAKDLGTQLTDSVRIIGSYFDVTPPEYIHSFVTEKGVAVPKNLNNIVPIIPVSRWLEDQLARSTNLEERK